MSFVDILNYQRYNGGAIKISGRCKGKNNLCAMFILWGYVK